MSDKEPLLKKSSQQSHYDDDSDGRKNNKRLSSSTFSDLRQCFGDKEADKQYNNLDDHDVEDSKNDIPVGAFYLFRFTDSIDLFLMFTTLCLLLFQALCITANMVIFSRLTGLFAIKSFGNDCRYQHDNSLILNMSNYICPEGIEINSSNYVQYH
ncbi:unnamed protein product, partial [Rotaria magnacalcarata]